MAITDKKALLNNQSILQNFGLVEEIGEQAAEIISGGKSKKFTVINNTNNAIAYTLDDVAWNIPATAKQSFYTDHDGKMSFDKDSRADEINVQKESLKDGKAYQFKPNAGNSNMIDLVLV
ncbi:hypothetical protein CDG77_32050 [Nostoc sp. 'Peltigera membranacea cyanobiont' 213]|uniref:hypothetical protein n=1 Tax=Nostoc sp. 'Peltigera membranacea cyanobiont' 213 TaxID=2014530 RepID=UPI000B957224|nr:hypothetical protein [Nostoc sp. 'Peltigera membranacea cyanobiont' 213]OYD86966.1 hypothetical protein CDG77_32050 [Nostoc sp. 'Peltigera membranacea cyanobiont' 213]